MTGRQGWWFLLLVLLFALLQRLARGVEEELSEYVVSECYGDIFNFDCGRGNKIRINKDFFGYSKEQSCRYSQGECIISNPKSNSLIHRFCTGHRVCTYYLVERRGCGGSFSNYQQVEYQCIPDDMVTDVCSIVNYKASSTYIASPNFPENYPPKLNCKCVVSSITPNAKVRMEIVYLAIKYTSPCRDWLSIGRRRTCGTTMDLFQGGRIPIEFRSDQDDSHAGFWLHFKSSIPGDQVHVQCGNVTLRPPKRHAKRPASSGGRPRSAAAGGGATGRGGRAQDQEQEEDVLVRSPRPEDKPEEREREADGRVVKPARKAVTPAAPRLNFTVTIPGRRGPPPRRATTTRASVRARVTAVAATAAAAGEPGRGPAGRASPQPSPPPPPSNPVRRGDDTTASSRSLSGDQKENFGGKEEVEVEATPSLTFPPIGTGNNTDNSEYEIGNESSRSRADIPEVEVRSEAARARNNATSGADNMAPDADHSAGGAAGSPVAESGASGENAVNGTSGGISTTGSASKDDARRGMAPFPVGPGASAGDNASRLDDAEMWPLHPVSNDLPAAPTDEDHFRSRGSGNGTLASGGRADGAGRAPMSTQKPLLPTLVPGIFTTSDSGSFFTLGVIIVAVCVSIGVLLVCVVLLIIFLRRHGTRDEQTQTPRPKTGSDGDSGQGLLVSRRGGGIVKSLDKALQIDLDSDADAQVEVGVVGVDVGDETDVDAFSQSSTSKGVQCTPNALAKVRFRDRKRKRAKTLIGKTGAANGGANECETQTECTSSSECVTPHFRALSDISDPGSCLGSDLDFGHHRHSLASMSQYSEVTLMPENAVLPADNDYYDSFSDPDWDQKSAISI